MGTQKTLLAATMLASLAPMAHAATPEAMPTKTYLLQQVEFPADGKVWVVVLDSGLTATECGQALAIMPEPVIAPNGNLVAVECIFDYD